MSAVIDTGLGLSISFADGPVLTIAGELDLANTPDLAAMLDALIDRGHVRVTVDVSELGFIDASGLGVLAAAQARLVRNRGEIRVRGASPMAYRIFKIAELVDALHVERADPDAPRELNDAGASDGVARDATRLAASSERADALADTLSRMMKLVLEMIPACVGASVTLRRRDYLMTPAASDDTFRDLDNAQYANRQGPCVDAATIGVQTHAAALAHEQRWQAFTPQAREHGIESILSSPLIIEGEPTGALNLYSRIPRSFLPIDQDLASVFASQAALLLHDSDATAAGEFEDRIHDALASRDIIAQAQGVLMERLGVDADAAYATLRQDSAKTSIPLRTRAGTIVAGTQSRLAPHSDGPANG